MNTTLSQKHILDITTLRNPFQAGPWDISFSEHLAGFSDAVDLCQTIHGAPTEDGENFGLSDAAYVLSSAGTLWSKRVDDTSTAARTTLNSLNDVSKAKKKNDTAEDKDKPVSAKRSGHPLALPFDIAKDDSVVKLLGTREKAKSSGNSTVDKLPLLSQDMYLSPSYPHLLPLLDCERIKPYLDEARKVKGVDWAEFKINVLPLNAEGYYPLGQETPVQNAAQIERCKFIPAEGAEFTPDPVEDIGVDYDDGTVVNDEDKQTVRQAETTRNDSSEKDAAKRRSEKNAPFAANDLQSNVPFERLYHINQRFAARKDAVTEITLVENPYRRRNKRVMKEKTVAAPSSEVGFFMNFWAFPDRELPYIDLPFVIKRYRFRLHAVEVAPGTRGKRGAKKKAEKTVVQFVSRDADDETLLAELASAPMDKGAGTTDEGTAEREEPICSHFGDDDRDNYEELDEPVGGEEALEMDAATAQDFNRMIQSTRATELKDRSEYSTQPDSSSSAECSFIAESDLQAWEVRLTNFLAVHEKATMSFDLEQYGKSLIQKCGGERSRSVIDIVGSNEVGRTSQNFCRTFLSLLDLANKKSVEFESAGGETGSGSQEGVSEDVTQVRMKFNAL